ncbi:MAG TPA: hypothetical protein G4O14_10445 [Anaerolineae bacterium]|nr:hypothetical protein [Anaerolineae bacterium]
MISYFERYQEFASAGYQNSRVWAELTSLGDDIRQEPLYSDARAVACETMTRAKHNIEVLIERLHTLEYHFLYPQEIWNTPDPDTIMTLDAFEAQYGLLPLSIRMWYEVVGSLCLMGSHPKLSYMDSFDSGASNPFYSDPLVINPIKDPPLPFYADMVFDYTGEETTDPPYGIWLAPDAIQKANHSGGGPTQIMFPNPVMDAPLISDQWDGVLFVSYLQQCFQWGGFPGLRDSPDYPKEELDFLTKNLLPL